MKILDALRRARSLWLQAWPLWSVRVSAFGALITALAAAAPDTLLQVWNNLPDEVRSLLPAGLAHVVPTLLFAATIVVRLIPQKPAAERKSLLKSISGKVQPKVAGGIAAAVSAAVLIAMPLTQASEGTKLSAYQDPARIWTICTGRTTNVKAGDRATREQCAAWLNTELAEHMTAAAKSTPILAERPQVLAAAGDFHYNAGPGWWLKSPMRAHFAAGRWKEGCNAFAGYIVLARAPKPVPGATCRINSKGVRYCELPGLVKRRLREKAMCLTGSWQ